MPVFTKGTRFPRKILTRYRGGYTYLEVAIVIGIWVLAMRFIGMHHSFLLPILYLGAAIGIAQLTRLIPTDDTRLGKWLSIQARYFVRPHPLRPRRIVSGRRPPPPAKERHGGVILVQGRRPDDGRNRKILGTRPSGQLPGSTSERQQ